MKNNNDNDRIELLEARITRLGLQDETNFTPMQRANAQQEFSDLQDEIAQIHADRKQADQDAANQQAYLEGNDDLPEDDDDDGRAESVDRFEEIQQQMQELLDEASEILDGYANPIERKRSHAYWYAQIKMALGDDHGYVGSATHSMQDSLKALREEGSDEGLESDEGFSDR